MRLKKLFTTTIVLSLVGAAALTGCSSKDNTDNSKSNDTNNTPPAKAEKVTITLNGWGSSPKETELFEKVLADFEAKHTNIDVNFEVIQDQYMDVIKTRLVGGEAGDVFFLDAFEAPGLIAQDVLEPLDQYVTDDFDVKDFEEPLLNAFKQDNTTYGFPKDFSTLGLFYNKKAFEEAGITSPPTTWEELREVAKTLTKDKDGDGKVDQYGLGVAPELARQFFMVQAYGGKVVDNNFMASFATPEGIQGLQLVIDQYRNDKSSAQPSDVGAGWGGEMFGQGKAAMVIEGPWAIPYIQDTFPDTDFGISEVPTVNNKKNTMAYTVAYVMNKNSEHKKEAWELISYLTGKEGMKTWTSLGIALPSRKSVAAELGFDKDPLRAPLVSGAAYATPWQGGPYMNTIMTNFNNQFVSAFIGEQALDEAMKKAEETANSEIQASK